MTKDDLKKTAKTPRRILFLFLGFILAIGSIYAFTPAFRQFLPWKSNSVGTTPQSRVRVVASFYPLAEFAKNVGGDFVEVRNITPPGAEPHDYEPTPQDIAQVYDARLFIFNGNGLEPWGDKIERSVSAKGVTVVKMSAHLESLKNSEPGDKETGEYDPHFWLDPVSAGKEVDNIADALIQIDAPHRQEYDRNRQQFRKQLAELDQEYKNGLAHCRLREIVTSHDAFNYLAGRYGLTVFTILGLSPDEEPSPRTIARVADVARQRQIKFIFFETLVSPKLSETIAKEIGAKTLVLNPIEGLTDREIQAGKNYISIMKDNLANLRIALSCR